MIGQSDTATSLSDFYEIRVVAIARDPILF